MKKIILASNSPRRKELLTKAGIIIETKVYFKNLSEQEIDEYVDTGEPLDKGGAYAIQGLGSKLVEKIEGDYSSMIGLPINDVLETLKEFGID